MHTLNEIENKLINKIGKILNDFNDFEQPFVNQKKLTLL